MNLKKLGAHLQYSSIYMAIFIPEYYILLIKELILCEKNCSEAIDSKKLLDKLYILYHDVIKE